MKILLITFFLLSINIHAKEKLIIVKIENSAVTDISFSILKEAYSKLNITVTDKLLPAKRALENTNQGKFDGELIRIRNINKKYKNLVMVDVAILNVQGVIFTKNKNFVVNDWNSLKPYKLAFLRGLVLASKKTEGFNVSQIATNEQLFNMLDKGRFDVVYSGKLTGLDYINKLKLKDINILEKPLVQVDVFHYVHKKHKDLVPRLKTILNEMKKSGRIEEIKKTILNKQ